MKDKENLNNVKHMYSEVAFEYLSTLIEHMQNKTIVINKIKFGIFLDDMIKFLMLPRILKTNPEELARNSNIEIQIFNNLLERFTEPAFELDERVRYVKTPVLQHKLVFHIIVLCLILNDFKTDMSVLAKSMKIDNKQMFQYCREIGCNFPGIKNEYVDDKKIKKVKNLMVQLKAPLKLNIEKEHKRYSTENKNN